jgi:hypothetical protein
MAVIDRLQLFCINAIQFPEVFHWRKIDRPPKVVIPRDTAFSIVVGLAFLETYLGRVGKSPLFTVMAALLAGAMLAFIAAVGVHIVRRSVVDERMALR